MSKHETVRLNPQEQARQTRREESARAAGYESWHDALVKTKHLSAKKAGNLLGFDEAPISRWREKYDIPPPLPVLKAPAGFRTVSESIRKTAHLPLKDAGVLLGLSPTIVSERRKALGIASAPPRPPRRASEMPTWDAVAQRLGYASFDDAVRATLIPGNNTGISEADFGIKVVTWNKHRARLSQVVTKRMDRQAVDAGFLSWRDAIRATIEDPIDQTADLLDVSVAKIEDWRKHTRTSSLWERAAEAREIASRLRARRWTALDVARRTGLRNSLVGRLMRGNSSDLVATGTTERLRSLLYCPLPRPYQHKDPNEPVVRVSAEDVRPQIKQMRLTMAQGEVARLVSVTQTWVSAVETGKNKTVSVQERDRVLAAFAVLTEEQVTA